MTIYCGRTKYFLQEKLYENHSPSYYEQTVAIPFCERGKVCNSCYEILYTVPFTNGASSTIRLLHAYVTTGCFIVRLVEMGPSRIFLQGRTLSLLLLPSFLFLLPIFSLVSGPVYRMKIGKHSVIILSFAFSYCTLISIINRAIIMGVFMYRSRIIVNL